MKSKFFCVVLSISVCNILAVLFYLSHPPRLSPTPPPVGKLHDNYQLQSLGETVSSHELLEVEGLVERCMEAAHLTELPQLPSLLEQAKTNAKYLYEEYRKVIPKRSLDGYRSHCWKAPYSTQWNDTYYSGHIGNTAFIGRLDNRTSKLKDFHKQFPTYQFSTDLVCLPKVFLAGYPKCGSTFTYCFLNKIVYMSLHAFSRSLSLRKEGHFWIRDFYEIPKAGKVGQYLLNFIPGMDQISKSHSKEAIFIDGKINKMHLWPLFQRSEIGNVSNYCLLPVVMPKLIPGSKFIVVMRNPVSRIYSKFWYTCTRLHKIKPLNLESQLEGPEIFHNLTLQKITMFTNCMRDVSVPAISHACQLNEAYSSCIGQRLHLLEKCAQVMDFASANFSPKCFQAKVAEGLYYIHAKKWLSMIPKEDFLFLTLESLSQDPWKNARVILQFLNLKTDIVNSRGRIQEAVKSCRKKQQVLIDYHNDERFKMRRDTKMLLEQFYSPFNKLLSELIGMELPWKS